MMVRRVQRRMAWLATVGIGAVALLALVLDHRAHVLGVLPYLLLLACPLMHLRHAGQHGHAPPGHGSIHQHHREHLGTEGAHEAHASSLPTRVTSEDSRQAE